MHCSIPSQHSPALVAVEGIEQVGAALRHRGAGQLQRDTSLSSSGQDGHPDPFPFWPPAPRVPVPLRL